MSDIDSVHKTGDKSRPVVVGHFAVREKVRKGHVDVGSLFSPISSYPDLGAAGRGFVCTSAFRD
jgi:hypothetical protein